MHVLTMNIYNQESIMFSVLLNYVQSLYNQATGTCTCKLKTVHVYIFTSLDGLTVDQK